MINPPDSASSPSGPAAALLLPGAAATPAAEPRDRILIVDDSTANLDLLGQMLEERDYHVSAAPGGEVALRVAASSPPDLILLDVMMPGLDGFETCRRLKASPATRDVPVLFLSARDEMASLLLGFEAGAVDYIVKPFQPEEVLIRVGTHLKISRLARELLQKNRELEQRSAELAEANEGLRREIGRREKAEEALESADEKLSALSDREQERWGLAGFVGKSRTIGKILRDVGRVRNFGGVNVLVTGESGTGKELVARAIHFGSPRAKGPFVPVNCVAIPEELAESMLFGHLRGAFTGATMDRKGYFELADGGTLFLDEIGDMPVTLQAKLLRVLEDGRMAPLGSAREKQVDVRVVAATNADLESQIEAGSFREDLFFRLAQFTVEAPPLRERREDVPLLASHFLRLFAKEMGAPVPRITAEALGVLAGHAFPGNVRELKNLIERALIESGGGDIRGEHLHLVIPRRSRVAPFSPPAEPRPQRGGAVAGAGPALPDYADLPLNLEAAENVLIKRALAETGGNIAEAARRLGVNRTRIYRKLSEGKERKC